MLEIWPVLFESVQLKFKLKGIIFFNLLPIYMPIGILKGYSKSLMNNGFLSYLMIAPL